MYGHFNMILSVKSKIQVPFVEKELRIFFPLSSKNSKLPLYGFMRFPSKHIRNSIFLPNKKNLLFFWRIFFRGQFCFPPRLAFCLTAGGLDTQCNPVRKEKIAISDRQEESCGKARCEDGRILIVGLKKAVGNHQGNEFLLLLSRGPPSEPSDGIRQMRLFVPRLQFDNLWEMLYVRTSARNRLEY